jgi:electron transfer flavoprotein beta subunit
LKDDFSGKVTALSMGPPQARSTIRKAIAVGADQGILLSDRAFAGSDTLATSYVLATAIAKIMEKEGLDLILCGKQAIDGETGQVGPGIAARLGIPVVTNVIEIDSVDFKEKTVEVKQKLDVGCQTLRTRLPALLTIGEDVAESRYETLPDMIKATRYKPVVWNKESFEVDEENAGFKGSPTRVMKVFPPPAREPGELFPVRVRGPTEEKESLRDAVTWLLEGLSTQESLKEIIRFESVRKRK